MGCFFLMYPWVSAKDFMQYYWWYSSYWTWISVTAYCTTNSQPSMKDFAINVRLRDGNLANKYKTNCQLYISLSDLRSTWISRILYDFGRQKKVIFQFPSNSCNILLKRSFWTIFYVLESSDSVFCSFPTFVLCWRGSFSLQSQPGFQHRIQ